MVALISPKKSMRNLIGTLKDKISLIKATIHLSKSTTPASSFHHIAVLRATTHDPSTPPPDFLIDDVLSLGHHPLPAASACVSSLVSRLHSTRNAYVALKCLFTLHHILARGSSVFRHQITHSNPHPSNFLNLSDFRDDFDPDSWELSSWVRWYAGVIEQSLIASRSLGFDFTSKCAHPARITVDRRDRILGATNSDLMGELRTLVEMVEQICRAPESLEYQRIGLVYELMKLVGEDYRMTMREVSIRVGELGERVEEMGVDELAELVNVLGRLEGCGEKLILMFLNKKRSDGVWDMIGTVRTQAGMTKKRKENMGLVMLV